MNFLRIASEKINIDRPLQLGNRYQVFGEIEVRSDENLETDVEEKDRLFKARWTASIDILNDKGRAIKGENKSASKKLRGAIYFLLNSEDCKDITIDDEEFYQKMIKDIITNLPAIYHKFYSKD